MKNLFTILLLGVMLTQAFSKFLLVIDYEVNKEFIAEFLCINKSKPELQCHGHCFLQKNLKKADEAEKQASSQNKKADITLFYQAFFRMTSVAYSSQFSYPAFKQVLYHSTSFRNTFHPPQVTV